MRDCVRFLAVERIKLRGIRVVLSLLLICSGRVGFLPAADPPLSHLMADRHTPVYTTYAAAMERSSYLVDEGYHFTFYDSTRGADFVTDTGGDWCLAFQRGARFVYALADAYRQPIITVNYPDLVRYFYYPFPDLRVEGAFLVYSSAAALWEVALINEGKDSLQVDLYPFFHNRSRAYHEVTFHPSENWLWFTHEEFPDGWTISHKVPYEAYLQNVWVLSFPPQRMASFRSFRWGHVDIPQQVDLEKSQQVVVWGLVNHADGERCRHRPPEARLTIWLEKNRDILLTETAPRWGRADPNINGNGWYSVELGNFPHLQPGQRFRLVFSCHATGQQAVVEDTIPAGEGERTLKRYLTLQPAPQSVPAVQLQRDIWGSGTEIRLYWKAPAPGLRYHVYRRDYRREGVYRRIATALEDNFYTDKNLTGDPIYGYVVVAEDEQGRQSPHSNEVNNLAGSDFLTDVRYPEQQPGHIRDLARVVTAPTRIVLPPGGRRTLRMVRMVAPRQQPTAPLLAQARALLQEPLEPYQQANEALFSRIPELHFENQDQRLLYWSAFSLMRQVFLPPEGKCSYNYYVFSREPTWGWGHGGQVFHESLTMLAYAWMDPVSAMNSQRVYRERQHRNGYINYRTGPYLDETIPYNNQLTTSAPWYAWQNWEVYQITGDEAFLAEMYPSSVRFFQYVTGNRDSDGDGLYEWGAHAVLESVRDGLVAVWDEVGWPNNFECLDLNCMLVMEARALASMAHRLNRNKEARQWEEFARQLADRINQTMWDEETGFYYHVDKKDHDFTFRQTNDLKREEIIGFLPLWAGIATPEQAGRLVEKLTDPRKFWRRYGVPTLAADDPYYNPKGYWNGPVWVEWNMLIVEGLLRYGYRDLARQLTRRVAENMIARLKKDHQFWEFYSPDEQWAGYHRQYIWAGTINRMLMQVLGVKP